MLASLDAAPMPNSNLPPEITSKVAAILASKEGFLKELQETMVPSRIRVVKEESAESVVQHSRMGRFPNIKWSSNHTE